MFGVPIQWTIFGPPRGASSAMISVEEEILVSNFLILSMRKDSIPQVTLEVIDLHCFDQYIYLNLANPLKNSMCLKENNKVKGISLIHKNFSSQITMPTTHMVWSMGK